MKAIEESIAAGVNVNVTLLFSLERYDEIHWAFIRGLERRVEAGEPIDDMHSVASFFVSRVDTAVDKQLGDGSPLAGKAAVANAKMAYQQFLEITAATRGRRSRPPARGCSGRSGRPPAPRTRRIRTCSTSRR